MAKRKFDWIILVLNDDGVLSAETSAEVFSSVSASAKALAKETKDSVVILGWFNGGWTPFGQWKGRQRRPEQGPQTAELPLQTNM